MTFLPASMSTGDDDRLVVVVRDSDSDEIDRLVVENLLQRPVSVDTAGLREVAALLLDIPDTVQVNDVALNACSYNASRPFRRNR